MGSLATFLTLLLPPFLVAVVDIPYAFNSTPGPFAGEGGVGRVVGQTHPVPFDGKCFAPALTAIFHVPRSFSMYGHRR